MDNKKYEKLITIISQNEVVGQPAVEATNLLLSLKKEDLQEKDFNRIDSFITVTRTTMTQEEYNHIDEILSYVRGEEH
ncbi:MAG: hypothetical protein ACERKK_08900 [Poseidonibacter sp.]|uniref:hypothetical protein n=1 Tax=Poseidonibacter sp. TaxID=2321188 RepID=UPI00359D7461